MWRAASPQCKIGVVLAGMADTPLPPSNQVCPGYPPHLPPESLYLVSLCFPFPCLGIQRQHTRRLYFLWPQIEPQEGMSGYHNVTFLDKFWPKKPPGMWTLVKTFQDKDPTPLPPDRARHGGFPPCNFKQDPLQSVPEMCLQFLPISIPSIELLLFLKLSSSIRMLKLYE